eukprot:141112-Ditylum_brightwellii.AAC.1
MIAVRAKQAKGKGKVQKHKLTRAMKTGVWLMAVPNHLNGTALCNRCGAKLTVEHGLTCSKGGLVLLCQEDVNREWGALDTKALTHSAVAYEPTIYTGRPAQGGDTGKAKEGKQQKSGKKTTPLKEDRSDVATYRF